MLINLLFSVYRRRCAFCDYSEPCQWSLRKHFRLKHPSRPFKVLDCRDAEKDTQVEEVVEECVIQLQQAGNELAAEADASTWRPPGAMAQRGMRKRAGIVDPTPSQNLPPRRPSPSPSPSSGQETSLLLVLFIYCKR